MLDEPMRTGMAATTEPAGVVLMERKLRHRIETLETVIAYLVRNDMRLALQLIGRSGLTDGELVDAVAELLRAERR